ncbi:hypothetical protein AM499_00935 [Bacillus sp. FJAT-22090]|uniref:hypothetical protein n=1 Tax=Bacillus sp. FJAT-22090 TaxID=1581038 RepID=UPI0006ADAC9F|nr:hypothetical protein [Bacillus sp. FJAT-22090]ALC84545.1 hypothetical protein AM499_00935 [Bacillus sp. FJAT-22090]
MSKVLELNELDIFSNSADVWEFLQKRGGIDTKYYDKGIESDLRDNLGLSHTISVKKQLQDKEISIELFLQAFFTSLNPFSQMFNDLIKLFESNSIRETNESILIKFDFQNEIDSLEFNLDQFKVWVKEWKSIKTKINLLDINKNNLYRLQRIFDEFNDIYKFTTKIDYENKEYLTTETSEWLKEYYLNWPNGSNLILPKTNNRNLNDLLNQIQVIFNSVIDSLSLLEVNYSKLYTFLSESEKNNNQDELPDYAWNEVDFWAGNFLKQYSILIYGINNNSDSINVELIRNLCVQLELYLSSISNSIENSAIIQELMEFLQLPIWKKRYDFYATWILTQISDSLGRERLQFHTTNGKLQFSFAGSHLATTNAFPELHIWSELRSTLLNPIGKGRKNGIQPDYSIIIPPLSDIVSSTLLVVECKQYRRASKKNFNNALIDYANGRPNAEIVLVNYGPVNNKILNEIEPNLRTRTHIIGEMKPGNIESIKKFKELVQKATKLSDTKNDIPRDIDKKVEWNNSRNVNIKLTWDELPLDLDLNLFLTEPNKNCHVINYNNKGNKHVKPFIELEKDITNGKGPEIVTINKFLQGNYLIAIYNFSNDQPLTTSNGKIEVEIDNKNFIFECPKNGEGRWWVVLEASPFGGDFFIHNKIQDNIPESNY